MDNLFSPLESNAMHAVSPLAVRMRPRTLEELVGQLPVIGEGTWLRGAILADSLSSIILFGPAGTGKTTLAQIIARVTKAHFTEVSAISGGVSDLRRVIDEAKQRLVMQNMRTILFVDEIHRFSRSQQDALLHAVEDRTLVLIGATTENPFFEVNSALISRSRVIEFKTLSDKDIVHVVNLAVQDERGLGGKYLLSALALKGIVTMSGGDARAALTTLELASELAKDKDSLTPEEWAEFEDVEVGAVGAADDDVADAIAPVPGDDVADASAPAPAPGDNAAIASASAPVPGDDVADASAPAPAPGDTPTPAPVTARDAALVPVPVPAPGTVPRLLYISTNAVLEATPRRSLPYDKKGDTHYDVISAFIKSMRGSDPDAAVYWLARMIEGGEDPKFIARRIMIFASEDVGNADPQALLIAQAAFMAAQSIGYPECQLNLSQAAIYMALAPKSNSATNAIFAALSEVRTGPARHVPNHLRDRHRPGAEDYGKYHYPHLDARGWVEQQYLPDGLNRGAFYKAGERGWESYRSQATKSDRNPKD